jgi:L-amino acid N-acyltransferase YncA
MGFVETGRMPRIGEKGGKRRTMVLLQKELAES